MKTEFLLLQSAPEFKNMFNALQNAVHVPRGTDRANQNRMKIWGLIPLAVKVSSKDTGGSLFVFEHQDMCKGGPPRHIHHDQDEWFYVVAGRYVMEIADKRYELKAGDSLLAPRKIAHAWACVSDEPGTLLTAVTPAGTFETFILDTARHPTLPSPDQIAKTFSAHGMTVVGPPLEVD
jgi:quercetin dioxygenase-like cupin family protein